MENSPIDLKVKSLFCSSILQTRDSFWKVIFQLEWLQDDMKASGHFSLQKATRLLIVKIALDPSHSGFPVSNFCAFSLNLLCRQSKAGCWWCRTYPFHILHVHSSSETLKPIFWDLKSAFLFGERKFSQSWRQKNANWKHAFFCTSTFPVASKCRKRQADMALDVSVQEEQ